jgi:hypothetical protein
MASFPGKVNRMNPIPIDSLRSNISIRHQRLKPPVRVTGKQSPREFEHGTGVRSEQQSMMQLPSFRVNQGAHCFTRPPHQLGNTNAIGQRLAKMGLPSIIFIDPFSHRYCHHN